MNTADAFWGKVDRAGTGCWPWLGSRDGKGYGLLRWVDGKVTRAHRVAFALSRDVPWPVRTDVLHACDNPPCCRPDHIRDGSHSENMREMAARGRAATGDRNGTRAMPASRPRGERHPRAKLREADVLEIRRLVAEGMTHAALAARFGVDDSQISRIASRVIWAHL